MTPRHALGAARDHLVRLLGGDPRRVAALARGMRRASEGRSALLEERRETGVPTELVPVLVGMALVMISLGLSAATGLLSGQPHVATLVVAFVHAAFVGVTAALIGAPALLSEDDAALLGWWPLSARDLVLARLLVVLRPVLLGSAVLCALPLLVHAVLGPLPVLSALALAFGLALQVIAMVGAVVAAIAGAVKILGRRAARRVLIAVAVIAGLGAAVMPGLLADSATRAPERLEWILAALPPGWFAAWGTLGAGTLTLAPLALSVLCAIAIIPAALRALATSTGVERPQARAARPRPAPAAWLVGALLRPALRTREGRAMRLLMVAHLREEWRLGLLAWAPLLGLVAAAALVVAPDAAFAALGSELASGGSAPGPLPVRVGFGPVVACVFAAIPAALIPLASESHAASWLLAQSDLVPERVLAATRSIGRVLVLGPILVISAALAARLGTPILVMLADLLVAALTFEITMRAIQARHLIWPFSRPWDGPPDLLVIGLGAAAAPLGLTVLMALAFAYDHGHATRLATCGVLLATVIALDRSVVSACRAHGLRLEIAPPEAGPGVRLPP